jgi:hypothetical protein
MVARSLHNWPQKLVFFLLMPTLLFFFAVRAEAASVILAWDANDEPDLAGYTLYGREGLRGPPWDEIGTYPEEELSDPLNPMVTVTDLKNDTAYYFTVTAYDTEENESGFSRSVCAENGAACQNNTSSGTATSGGGGGGGGCFLTISSYGFDKVSARKPLIWLALIIIGLAFFRKN